MKKSILILAMMFVITMVVNAQNQLTVKIGGIDNPKGDLYVALFSSNDPFLGKSSKGKVVKVEGNETDVIFAGLETGQYAITIFHDVNSNGKLDLGQYGIPVEKYGFSNDVDPAELKRSPTFDECVFEVNADMNIVISLLSASK